MHHHHPDCHPNTKIKRIKILVKYAMPTEFNLFGYSRPNRNVKDPIYKQVNCLLTFALLCQKNTKLIPHFVINKPAVICA